jgi:ParB family chromosome partitioning protein
MKTKPKNLMSAKIRLDMFGASADLPRIIEIELTRVQTNPDQPRKYFSESSLLELKQSIAENGLLQPILVKQNEAEKYLVVAGERRFRVHQLLGLETIAAIVTQGDTDEVSLIENIQREQLLPMEIAEALGGLIQTHGYTHEDVARVIGKSRSTVTEYLSLLRLPDHVRQKCRTSDKIPKSTQVELARMEPQTLASVWERVQSGESRVRTVRLQKAGRPDLTDLTPVFEKWLRNLQRSFMSVDLATIDFSKSDLEMLLNVKQQIDVVFCEVQRRFKE